MANIKELIDKQDNFELIRDEIAAILALEVAGQKALATAAGRNPDLWDFEIYTERSNPWNIFYDSENKVVRDTPLVNVCFDSLSVSESETNLIKQSKCSGQFYIDALAAKPDRLDRIGSNHEFGDELAAKDVQRIARLCRNILMAGIYTYIFTSSENGVSTAVHGIVTKRQFSNIQIFKPDLNDRPADKVIGARLVLSVDFLEFSPQYTGETLETIFSRCTRGSDGSVYFDMLTDTTA